MFTSHVHKINEREVDIQYTQIGINQNTFPKKNIFWENNAIFKKIKL